MYTLLYTKYFLQKNYTFCMTCAKCVTCKWYFRSTNIFFLMLYFFFLYLNRTFLVRPTIYFLYIWITHTRGATDHRKRGLQRHVCPGVIIWEVPYGLYSQKGFPQGLFSRFSRFPLSVIFVFIKSQTRCNSLMLSLGHLTTTVIAYISLVPALFK